MCKLTNAQQKQFNTFVTEQRSLGYCTNAFYAANESLVIKLEKMGYIKFVTATQADIYSYRSFETNDGRVLVAMVTELGMINGESENSKCWKCGGTGRIVEYGHVENGRCFECGGTGKNK